ncbi:MAG: crosslink repair DNA glycosylase YcaQ family protein [Planctomycetota bacterium]|nr:crosslink repair DNA glycosylase YcaQ family protein [Planctomycetota bacterium]
MKTREISKEQARRYLVGHFGLGQFMKEKAPLACRILLKKLRCIQLDPLDVVGSNADLVAMARIQELKRGAIYQHLLPTHSFEHFAKERCLLPAYAFPYYRDYIGQQVPWWRQSQRMKKLSEPLVDAVLKEVIEHGPILGSKLSDRGRVKAINYSGWKGTSKASRLALELLWARCKIVVSGRRSGGKVYSSPEASLGDWSGKARELEIGRWALLERVEAAGLLTVANGPQWGMLSEARRDKLPEKLVGEGIVEAVTIDGSRRVYLAPKGFLKRRFGALDDHMRILGPLEPLIWDRKLIHHVFDFEYIWEVYKPEKKRRWGWYVCPLLHRGQLVGRFEGRMEDGQLKVLNLWPEANKNFDEAAWNRARARHEKLCARNEPAI